MREYPVITSDRAYFTNKKPYNRNPIKLGATLSTLKSKNETTFFSPKETQINLDTSLNVLLVTQTANQIVEGLKEM
jgi:hypothetical protein